MTNKVANSVNKHRRQPEKAPARQEKSFFERHVTERIRRRLLPLRTKHVHGPKSVPIGVEELAVVCLVRDGRPYVKSFVEHYRALGAKHLVFLDNGSTDGTLEALCGYEGDVTVLSTPLPYKYYKYLMKQYLHSKFGGGRWSLYVDIDELFDYPYSDIVGLESLLRYLTKNGYTAVTSYMLDMFPEEPLTGDTKHDDEPLKERHRFYDLSGMWRGKLVDKEHLRQNEIPNHEIETVTGGIRKHLFGVTPNLTKFPLVLSDGKVEPSAGSSHRISGAKVADISCVLLHYKFLERFHEQARKAVAEGNYYADSFEYRKYLEVLENSPKLSIKRKTSKEMSRVNDLVDDGFLIVTEDYLDLVEELEKQRLPEMTRSTTEELASEVVRTRAEQRRTSLRSRQLDAQLREKSRELWRMKKQDREGKSSTENKVPALAKPPVTTPVTAPSVERKFSVVHTSAQEFSDTLRPLFVGGCQRSGTTAFVEYMNEHEEVFLGYERYKRIPKSTITPDLFTFERILDYREGETNKPWNIEQYVRRHGDVIARKDAAKLAWIGDKNPNFVKNMDILQKVNPGARFIMLYRPVDEVAESWEARASNPDDHWLGGKDGFGLGLEAWNKAMRAMRKFVEESATPRVLILDYKTFFTKPEDYVPLLSGFLEVEFPDGVLDRWREMSRGFESDRREKSPLTEEQEKLISTEADREAEAWVLKRIEDQWRNESLYARQGDPAILAELASIEGRAYKAERELRLKSAEKSAE